MFRIISRIYWNIYFLTPTSRLVRRGRMRRQELFDIQNRWHDIIWPCNKLGFSPAFTEFELAIVYVLDPFWPNLVNDIFGLILIFSFSQLFTFCNLKDDLQWNKELSFTMIFIYFNLKAVSACYFIGSIMLSAN